MKAKKPDDSKVKGDPPAINGGKQQMKNGIEQIFIKYANLNFDKWPEELRYILLSVSDYLAVSYEFFSELDHLIGIAQDYYDKYPLDFGQEGEVNTVAFRSIYDYKFLRCDHCMQINYDPRRHYNLSRSISKNCMECFHLYFLVMLDEIINGRPLDEVARGELLFLIKKSYANKKDKIEYNWKKELLYIESEYHIDIDADPIDFIKIDPDIDPLQFITSHGHKLGLTLNQIIMNIISLSLVEFILNHGVEKLKKCRMCKRYFISKTRRSSHYCSDKCKRDFNNRKRIKSGEHAAYMREKRSEGYYP